MAKEYDWQKSLKLKEEQVEQARCLAAGIPYIKETPEEEKDLLDIFDGKLPTAEEIEKQVRKNAHR